MCQASNIQIQPYSYWRSQVEAQPDHIQLHLKLTGYLLDHAGDTLLGTLDPDETLKGYAYARTYNERLGLTRNPADFHVGIPFNPWSKRTSGEFESTLGKAFKNVLREGLADVSKSDKQVFIDITQLSGGWVDFFYNRKKQAGSPNNLAHEIGALVHDLPETVTPVIRFLIGGDQAKDASSRWDELRNDFNKVFWPDGNPNFEAKQDPDEVKQSSEKLDSLAEIVRQMITRISEEVDVALEMKERAAVKAALDQFNKETIAKQLSALILPSIS
ncbi:hypothetical protein E8E11_005009 [Didymella keratinophila]|nr:hypothetical protein E8E11_005009 [Didymella keratinophila]